jgi:membrane-bound inhibitor of C-type lysozyme
MKPTAISLALATLLLTALPASAAQSSLQIELTTTGDFERRVIAYDCAAEAPLVVTYINAAPNFLALVPVADEPEPMVLAAVLSGSGVRYAGSKWAWWNKGIDGSLYDRTLGEDAEPVLTCTEINNTP